MRKGDFESVDQKQQAMELMRQAHCDPNMPCTPQEWNKLQEALVPQYTQNISIQNRVFSNEIRTPLQRGRKWNLFEYFVRQGTLRYYPFHARSGL